MDLMDKKTGEVLEIVEKEVPFRTITDLKNYNDDEHYEEGTSQVDLTGYEPLESIIARCTRVMRAPGGQEYRVVDVDAVKAEAGQVTEIYDCKDAKTIDEAFCAEDPTLHDDFDLSDASRIMNEISAKSGFVSGGVAPQIANDDADKKERLAEKLNEKDDAEKDEIEKHQEEIKATA